MQRVIGAGNLRKGFTIMNSVFKIELSPETPVTFLFDTDLMQQRIQIGNSDNIFLFRSARAAREHLPFMASVYGRMMRMHYDWQHPPYPCSFFKF